MGKPYEWTRYNTAVEASALSDDIKVIFFMILLHHKLISAALSIQCEVISSMLLLFVSPKRMHFSSIAWLNEICEWFTLLFFPQLTRSLTLTKIVKSGKISSSHTVWSRSLKGFSLIWWWVTGALRGQLPRECYP